MDELRWVSCSKEMSWSASQYRHLNTKGSLHTVCGNTASHPEVWRGNSKKPTCPKCSQMAIGRLEALVLDQMD